MPPLQPWSAELPFHPLLLLAALALEPLLGEARGPVARLPHPVRLVGQLIGLLDRKLNREDRSEADRRRRGIVLVVVVCLLAGSAGAAVDVARPGTCRSAGCWSWRLMISLLAQRSLFRHVRRVGEALREGGLEAGRAQVAHIVGRDVRETRRPRRRPRGDRVLRRELLRRRGGAGVLVCPVRPAGDARLQGDQHDGQHGRLPLGALSRLRLGGGEARRRQPICSRRGSPACTWPARRSPCRTRIPARGLRTMIKDAGKHRSPNAGWPEAAMAGALGLSLAGPRRYPASSSTTRGSATARRGDRARRHAGALAVRRRVRDQRPSRWRRSPLRAWLRRRKR